MVRSLVTLLLTCTALASQAQIRTILEPRVIDEMETVRLTLRSDGTSQVDQPDFTPLEKDFELLGTQTSSRISSINGRTTAVIEYQINLRPRRVGRITLPRIKIGNDFSEAIELTVRALDPSVRRTIESMIFFETELTANPVYVQAETVLVRRLFYSNGVQIYSDLPGEPEIDNAVVVALGDTRSTATVRNGQRYGVIEQRFAIFPEQSGTLQIPEISVTSSVRLQSGGRVRRSGIRVSTEALQLQVLPIPAAYPPGEPWLPARSVELSHHWDPNTPVYDVGQPVKLRVNAQVSGNIGSAIPPVTLSLPAGSFKVYPEAPGLSEDKQGASVVGTRGETFALIPTTPGRAEIPALTLTWWDTRAEEVRIATLPSRQITISGALPPAPVTQPASQEISADDSSPAADPARDLTTTTTLPLGSSLLALAATLLLALVVLLWRFRRSLFAFSIPESPRKKRRLLLATLEASCAQPDAGAIKDALTRYLAAAYNCPLGEALARFEEEAAATELLAALDRALYAQNGSRLSKQNVADLLLLAKQASRRKANQPPDPLPALYPRSA